MPVTNVMNSTMPILEAAAPARARRRATRADWTRRSRRARGARSCGRRLPSRRGAAARSPVHEPCGRKGGAQGTDGRGMGRGAEEDQRAEGHGRRGRPEGAGMPEQGGNPPRESRRREEDLTCVKISDTKARGLCCYRQLPRGRSRPLEENASIASAGTSYPMVEWGLNLNMTRKSYSLLRRAATVRMSSNATVPKLAIRNR